MLGLAALIALVNGLWVEVIMGQFWAEVLRSTVCYVFLLTTLKIYYEKNLPWLATDPRKMQDVWRRYELYLKFEAEMFHLTGPRKMQDVWRIYELYLKFEAEVFQLTGRVDLVVKKKKLSLLLATETLGLFVTQEELTNTLCLLKVIIVVFSSSLT